MNENEEQHCLHSPQTDTGSGEVCFDRKFSDPLLLLRFQGVLLIVMSLRRRQALHLPIFVFFNHFTNFPCSPSPKVWRADGEDQRRKKKSS
uniref:Uncharacterized protein n=1 Tax=Nelumbo nucifera TaxID=4432 RepID=A0A822YGV1_NELNU|nr:TPA_asm: hypothetical protein HUJ06_010214 [Nelumbo nucifera]